MPVVLAVGGLLFTWFENRQTRAIEQNRVAGNQHIEHERAQDAIVKDYLDQMTELLLVRGLRTSFDGDEVRSVARARTLAALRGVDGARKATIVQFLYEAQLIGYVDSKECVGAIVHLKGSTLVGARLERAWFERANFAGADLRGTTLRGATLVGASFARATLVGARLERANFAGADLVGADLTKAMLEGADLEGTELVDADLSGTKLTGAILTGTDLSYCRGLTLDQLLQARSLHGAILLDDIDPADLGDKWSPPPP